MKSRVLTGLPLFFASILFASTGEFVLASPKIGDKAPAVKVATWLTQKPPVLPGEKGANAKIFLVEFWATWCPPCRESIPHLAKLHKKHQKDGLLILSISNEEPETVQGFLKKMKMPYYVGCDDDMQTNNAWADDIDYIPYAFLVNKDGLVVWSGNPAGDQEEMDRVIGRVIEGKYDIERARNAEATERKYKELMKELQPAFAARQEDKVFEILDKMIALKRDELQPYLIKRQLLRDFERMDEIVPFDTKIEATFKDSAPSLQQLLRIELEAPKARRNPELMLRVSHRLNELTKGRDFTTLAALAEVSSMMGLLDEAIKYQAEAVGLAPDEQAKQLQKVLEYYKTIKKLAARHRAESKASTGS